ncbi:hypothetical protein EAI30_07845 [Romboutsia ilealis]|uniref:Uncharacterized protein n=1 Tax=Romboutsia faecis TaxID=2764597 RepID=A0ABR7JKU0_9FIRM|nr:hypothetical protein [Romboutsia faecis]MBC5995226.1 hypothetical protein [Romboutsia faecis]MRN24525.1 hypothetical protein [Romboutsia ilealis]
MNKYYELLGLHVDDVKKFFEDKNINYTIKTIQGNKDKDKLIIPKVIKVTELEDSVELIITYFSDSLF